MAYAALSQCRDLAKIITIGAPLLWSERHSLVKFLARFPELGRHFDLRGWEWLAQRFLPWVPANPLLGMYINLNHIDRADIPPAAKDPLPFPIPTSHRRAILLGAPRPLEH